MRVPVAVLLAGYLLTAVAVLVTLFGSWPHRLAHECQWVPAAVYCPTGLGLR